MFPKIPGLPERLAVKIEDGPDCWIWVAARTTQGYGNVWWDGSYRHAHRVVYELLAGGIPEGMDLDHLCRVRECVNPGHLEPVTRAENLMRSPIAQSALNARKTHCPQGHEYDIVWADGKRRCSTCRRG